MDSNRDRPDPRQPDVTDPMGPAAAGAATLEAAFAAAVRHHNSGQLSQAAAIYGKILAARPEHVDSLHLLGVVMGRMGKSEAGVELIDRAVAINPNVAEIHCSLGNLMKDLGRLDDAVACYRRAIALKPKYAEAHSSLGVAWRVLGDLDEAVVALNRAIEIDPDLAAAYFNLGKTLNARSDLDGAVAAYRRAIEIQPGFFAAHSNLGSVLRSLEKSDDAVAALQRALELRPDLAEAHSNLGNALREAGQLEGAIDTLRRAVEIDPRLAVARVNLGLALQSNGEFDEAIACFRHAIGSKRSFVRAHADLVNALLESGDPRAALDACDVGLGFRPGNVRLLAYKAVALSELGERGAVRTLVDFDRLVRPSRFEAADGFDSLADFNAALARHVVAHPTLVYAPQNHATRFGMHSGELLTEPKGPVGVLEDMIGDAVEDYIAAVPEDASHPFLAGRPRSWRLTAWAVVMRSQGHQIPHIHPSAWLSGVYYVKLPGIVGTPGRGQEGWIEFGQPNPKFPLAKEPELRTFQPEEGLMLLFPSYFYHRTVPFEAAEERISIAFDVKPKS